MLCLFALLATFAPRLALLCVWLFTPLVYRAFDTFLVPLLGLIFLPFTTLFYTFAYIPGIGLTGWGWVWVIIGVLLDMGMYGGSVSSNRHRIPGYSSAYRY
jgi:hypothetical protein